MIFSRHVPNIHLNKSMFKLCNVLKCKVRNMFEDKRLILDGGERIYRNTKGVRTVTELLNRKKTPL